MTLGEGFEAVWNMSLTASAAIVCVLAVRLLLKSAPRAYCYALWAVVLFRLLCPVSVNFGGAMVGLMDSRVTEVSENTSRVEVVAFERLTAQTSREPAAPDQLRAAPEQTEQVDAPKKWEVREIIPWVWLAGVGAMGAYGVANLIWLKKRTAEAALIRENIYEVDGLGTAFASGILRPRIYLPSGLNEQERSFILLHEKSHLRRLDHVTKAVSFGALCVHWFNPLVWLAFHLAEKDMELSCDEAVLRQIGRDHRAAYAQTLLNVSGGLGRMRVLPLAYGQGNIRERVKNAMKWKKPKAWVGVICLLVCGAVFVACGGNPQASTETTPEPTGTEPLHETTAPTTIPTETIGVPTRTVKVDFGEMGSIEVDLPEDWEWEKIEETADFDQYGSEYRYGIEFWPKGHRSGRVGIFSEDDCICIPSDGLETRYITFPDGYTTYACYYNGSEKWSYVEPHRGFAAFAEENDWSVEEMNQALEIFLEARLELGSMRTPEGGGSVESGGGAVSVDLGEAGSIQLELPEDWEWEKIEESDDEEVVPVYGGVRFWPADDTRGYVVIYCMKDFLGIDREHSVVEQLTLNNGEDVDVYYRMDNGDLDIIKMKKQFIAFVFQTDWPDALFDQVLEITKTVQISTAWASNS